MTEVKGAEVARLQAKDAQAFCTLIERLQQPITRYLYHLVGDREMALDLAQDTFLQIYKEIGKTSADLALDAWVYRIATNYALRYLNRRRLLKFVSFLPLAATERSGNSSETSYEERRFLAQALVSPSIEDQAETRILVEQALSSLKPKDAACLQLHYGNGFTYEQISKILASSPEAVRKRVSRGVKKFRAIYGSAPAPQGKGQASGTQNRQALCQQSQAVGKDGLAARYWSPKST
ncbi:RNA polymerase sigma factor [Ktedonosporobacter rubrisoli]|uniref:RNA polymerase sigma factor n=1 Tax=Ktedonosporobacter rubrisoli TaxID=2509675 RepID=UPI0013EE9539|nr:RNA polymerase sigma factor [Ktedonosporobacter rubrisoli]